MYGQLQWIRLDVSVYMLLDVPTCTASDRTFSVTDPVDVFVYDGNGVLLVANRVVLLP